MHTIFLVDSTPSVQEHGVPAVVELQEKLAANGRVVRAEIHLMSQIFWRISAEGAIRCIHESNLMFGKPVCRK